MRVPLPLEDLLTFPYTIMSYSSVKISTSDDGVTIYTDLCMSSWTRWRQAGQFLRVGGLYFPSFIFWSGIWNSDVFIALLCHLCITCPRAQGCHLKNCVSEIQPVLWPLGRAAPLTVVSEKAAPMWPSGNCARFSMVTQKLLYVITSPTSTGERTYTPSSINGKLRQKQTSFGLIWSHNRVKWKPWIPFKV